VDKLLDEARTELDLAKRQALYARAARIAYGDDVHRIYLWHRKNIMGHSARLTGYRPIADGMIRLQGMRLQ
jgi:peptide/nickel transport system substrate-binding protein